MSLDSSGTSPEDRPGCRLPSTPSQLSRMAQVSGTLCSWAMRDSSEYNLVDQYTREMTACYYEAFHHRLPSQLSIGYLDAKPDMEQIAVMPEGDALFNESVTRDLFTYPTVSEVRHKCNAWHDTMLHSWR